jgi:hypothetical protein
LVRTLFSQLVSVSEKRYGAKDDNVKACHDGCGTVSRSDKWLMDLLEPHQWDPGHEGICTQL